METNTTLTDSIKHGIRETNNIFRVNFWMERAYQEDLAGRQDPYCAVGCRRQAQHYRNLAHICRGI